MTNAIDGCEVTKHLRHVYDGKWNNVIKFYKVVWNNHGEQDATWEWEDYLREVYHAFHEEW